MKELDKTGFKIIPNAVPLQLINNVLRELHLDLFKFGISPREIKWWKEAASWFPHLRFSDSVTKLRASLPPKYTKGVECEPQILVGPPNDSYNEPNSHIDQEPPWANGRKYRVIIGVPLTPFTKDNGGVRIWPFDNLSFGENLEPIIPIINVGDIFLMHPQLPHSGGPNMEGSARFAIYFRYLYDY